MNVASPEAVELEKKRRKLERLKERLADKEEEMADLRAELEQTKVNYTMQVGRFYAELDEIEAQIAEEELKLVPDDEEIKKKVEELRRRAEESAADLEEAEKHCNHKFNPTPEAKKAYHNLARLIHPDLATDDEERERRHELMARLNDAYAEGDQNLLNKLVEEYRDAPELVRGDAIGDELVRVIRQLAQVAARLRELESEKLKAELSEAYALREKARAEQSAGRDYFRQMSERAKTHIMKAQRRLNTLKNLNVAQEDYVREKYGMDINEFR
jgi:chromosome segregation ATPase